MKSRTILFFLLGMFAVAKPQVIPEQVMKLTMPAYTIALQGDLVDTRTCREELRVFRDGVDNRVLFALRMLDSSGEPSPGFLYGNNFWLGSRNTCLDIMNKVPLALENVLANSSYHNGAEVENPPYELNFFIAHFSHNTSLQYHVNLPGEDIISLGLCLPASCTAEDLTSLLKRMFHNRTLLVGELYSADFKLVEVKDLRDDYQYLYRWKTYVLIIVTVVSLILILAGTTYDLMIHQKQVKEGEKQLAYENNNTSGVKCSPESGEVIPTTEKRTSRIEQTLMCFSAYTNTRNLFSTKQSENAVSSLHGLKFLTMLWVIMAHTVLFMSDYMDNKPWGFRLSELLGAQILANAMYSVDSFFFISGFLLSYLFLDGAMRVKEKKPVNYRAKTKDFFLMLFRRYMRLTPTYLYMLAVVEINAAWYSKTTVFYSTERPDETCAKYWWRNALYINNFFSRDSMCMFWSWYLSNDTQFFVVGSFVLILSTIYYYTAISILIAMLAGTTVITGYISYTHGFIPTLDSIYRQIGILYDPPWVRIAPYIIGMITGFIIIKLKNKLHLSKRAQIICWSLSCSCNIFVLFGLTERHISVFSSAVYMALSKTAWGVGLGWLVVACSTNNAGLVNEFLSFKGWVPLSRLTYGVYLINPFLLHSVFLFNESSSHVDLLRTGTMFLGIAVCSFILSYVLALLIEIPNVRLMALLLSRGARKK